MKSTGNFIYRRDFLKGMAGLPFLGLFAFGHKASIDKQEKRKRLNSYRNLKLQTIDASDTKLLPPPNPDAPPIRLGLIGAGWRGVQLLESFGFIHPDQVRDNTVNGKYNKWLQTFLAQENHRVELRGICDTFKLHEQRAYEISTNDIRPGGCKGKTKPAIIYPSYREMMASDEIDAVIIATPDHWHAPMAIAAALTGKHVYLEKPMTQSIEEAISLRDTIKSTGVVFQVGHENRQQMSFRIATELIQKGVLGDISMVQTSTNRNGEYGAWIRKRELDHLGTPETINWKEFLGNTPWFDFDPRRYFNWQRFSEYGTGFTGNDFTHLYDCVNQVLRVGIPESVTAQGGQYYYKGVGDMPDILSASLHYPEKKLVMTYEGTLRNDIYRPSYFMGSEAGMHLDLGIKIEKDLYSERFKDVQLNPSDPLYVYSGESEVDGVTSATAMAYINGGYGATYIDGKVIDATFLHVKEWIAAIRGKALPSCNIDEGFQEAVTFNLINIALDSKKRVVWDSNSEKAVLL